MTNHVRTALASFTVAFLLAISQPTLSAQLSASVTVCGTVSSYTEASSLLPGAITIGGQPFVIAAGTTIANSGLIKVGTDLCLKATLNGSLQIVAPSEVRVNVTTTVRACGRITAYVAASSNASGLITCGSQTFPIAAGTTIENSDLIRINADLCLNATLNAFGEVVLPSSVTANITSTISLCGTVTAFVAATSAADGSIIIGGHKLDIAAGTVINNQDQIRLGSDFCLRATLNAFGQITVPSEIKANVTSRISVCGTVSAYVAASSNSNGSITIAGQSYEIAAGTTIANNDLIRIGASLCLNATVNVLIQIINPSEVAPPAENQPPNINVPGPQTAEVGVRLTFNVSATDPNSSDTVTLTASGLPNNATFAQMSGNPAHGSCDFTPSASQAGSTFTVNFTATDNKGASRSASVQITVNSSQSNPPANRPPILSVPGPQTAEVGVALTFNVAASDPDGDSVTLSAGAVPTHASFNPSTGTFSFTPSANQEGQTFVVNFTATDSKGATGNATVQITVVSGSADNGNGPPVISVPRSPVIVKVGDTLTFTVTASSPTQDCQVLITASGLPEHASFAAPSAQFRFVPVSSQAHKTYVVTFTATDCTGQSVTGTVTIVVIDSSEGDDDASPGHICVPVTKIFFATAPVGGECGFMTVSVGNMGRGTLRINSLKFDDGTHFRVEGASNLPLQLQSAGVIQLKIMFQPKAKGTINDTLTIETNDPENPTITISVKGKSK